MPIGSPSRGLLVAMVLLAAACGDEGKSARPTEPRKTAAEELALARVADEADRPDERRKHLDAAAKDEGDAGQVAATWLLSLALEAHDPAAALPWLDRIVKTFGGKGAQQSGRPVEASILAGALVDEAAAAARRLVEGPTPDLLAARRALFAGKQALGRAEMAPEDAIAIDATGIYLDFGRESDVLGKFQLRAKPVLEPRVVVFADHFQLLEEILPSVLKRWKKGMDVQVVGLLVGRVRHGIRREPATRSEESAEIAKRTTELGVDLLATVDASGAAVYHGIVTSGATVFVFDLLGNLVGRAAGAALDARVLDPIVTRLAPEAAPEPDPTTKPGPR